MSTKETDGAEDGATTSGSIPGPVSMDINQTLEIDVHIASRKVQKTILHQTLLAIPLQEYKLEGSSR